MKWINIGWAIGTDVPGERITFAGMTPEKFSAMSEDAQRAVGDRLQLIVEVMNARRAERKL